MTDLIYHLYIHIERGINMSTKKSQIQAKYDSKNCKLYTMKLNKQTDKDIITRLSAVPSMQGYIKQLIRADIKKEEQTMRTDICTILLNGSNTDRQTLYYAEGKLYSTAMEEPIDTPILPTIEAAEAYCYQAYGQGNVWDLQWIERD